MLRELDQRRVGDLLVTMEWDSEQDKVLVIAENEGECVMIYPPRGEERNAFLHPFAYEPDGVGRSAR